MVLGLFLGLEYLETWFLSLLISNVGVACNIHPSGLKMNTRKAGVNIILNTMCLKINLRFACNGGHSQTMWTRLGGWVGSQMSMIVHVRWVGGL